MKFYILQNQQPTPIADKYLWEMWMQYHEAACILHETSLHGTIVSTTFLGCSDEEEPLLFETIIIGGLHDNYSKKSSDWKEAKAEHKRALGIVMADLN